MALPIIVLTPNLLQQPERICNTNGSESKRAEKNEGEGREKNLEQVITEKIIKIIQK